MIRALVPLADGCEEMEAVITIDVLRRAQWEVVGAGFHEGPLTASRRVRLLPDAAWEAIRPTEYDVLAIPGGTEGVKRLRANPAVLAAVRDLHAAGKIVAAVCAGPLVLFDAGILAGKQYACYPGVEKEITGGVYLEQPVVVDGTVITSRGAGTTFAFALAIVAQRDGLAKAEQVARGMVLSNGR